MAHQTLPLIIAMALLGCDGKGGGADDTFTVDVTTDTVEDTIAADVPEDIVTDETEDTSEPACVLPDVPCATPELDCHDTPCTAPADPTCLSGHVVDEAGEPIYCQGVVACTAGTCYPGKSDENGFFTVSIPATGVDHLGLYFPGSPLRHTPFCRHTDLCDGPNRICEPYVLRLAPTEGTLAPDNETLTEDIRVQGPDTAAVILPAGADLKYPIGAFGLDEDTWLNITRYPLDEDVPCFIDPDNLPLALYVVTPYDTLIIEPGSRFDPVLVNAGLDLPNTTSLPADTVVNVYVLGGVHPESAGLEEGQWMPLTTATVTSDGARIQTADGDGIGYLTWFAIYPAS